MTSEKKTKTDSHTPKHTHSSGVKIAALAVVGALIIVTVVGIAIYWEKDLEPLVGVDLPNEAQETSESSSIIPYICEQDPENCEKFPLTFRGDDQESGEDETSQDLEIEDHPEDELSSQDKAPIITYPSTDNAFGTSSGMTRTFESLFLLQDLEERLESVEKTINEFDPLEQEVEILRLLVLLQSTKDGAIPFEFLFQSLAKLSDGKLQKLASQLPKDGKIIPFSQIPLIYPEDPSPGTTTASKGGMLQTWWSDFLEWGASVIQIKTSTEVEEGRKVMAFREATISGQYVYATAVYQDMDTSHQKTYALWYAQIQKIILLEAIRLALLHKLQEGV